MKLPNADIPKRTLKGALKEIKDAAAKLKFVARNLELVSSKNW